MSLLGYVDVPSNSMFHGDFLKSPTREASSSLYKPRPWAPKFSVALYGFKFDAASFGFAVFCYVHLFLVLTIALDFSASGDMAPPPIPWKTRPSLSSSKNNPKGDIKGKTELSRHHPQQHSHHHHHHHHNDASVLSAHEQRYLATSPLEMYVNAVYYPNWAVYQQNPPSSLNLRCLSHIFYAFAHVKEDGTAFLSDPWADTQIETDGTKGCLGSFMGLKKEHNYLKVILSVGGATASQNFAIVADNPTYRETFAQTCQQLVRDYEFDGIDIDWEHPSDTRQGHNFLLLLQSLRTYLPPPYLLTTALPAGEWALQHIDLYNASFYLDFINIMAYDFSGPWVPLTGHQAQLFSPAKPHNDAAACSGERAITYILKQNVPPQKVLLGIPAYGRSFLGADAIAQPYQKPGKEAKNEGPGNTFAYKSLPRPGASPEYVDREAVAVWSHGGDGGFVTYDNPETVRIKAAYVRQRGLGGIFFWTGTGDVQSGERSLVEGSYLELHRSF